MVRPTPTKPHYLLVLLLMRLWGPIPFQLPEQPTLVIYLYLILKGRVSHWTWIVENLLDCLAGKFAKHMYLSFSMLDFRRHHHAPILCGFWESEYNTLFTDASFQSRISPLIIYFFRKIARTMFLFQSTYLTEFIMVQFISISVNQKNAKT